MFRRLINSVVENTFQTQIETYPNPFTKLDTVSFGWLSTITPCFPVSAKNISILTTPAQFYDLLVKCSKEAKNRITLASLYLGNGHLETKLVEAIKENASFKKGSLKINILLDYHRGSRFEKNSRTMLMPLLKKDNRNCTVSLYHTPVLRGLTKRLAPDRWNEVFGLQHMKLYIFDETLIISGANLSNDYFTNRQDRYFVIQDKKLCDFYHGLVDKVQKFSLKMDSDNNLSLYEGWDILPYKGSRRKFVDCARESIEDYVSEAKEEQNNHKYQNCDTWIFPLIQMGQLDIHQDSFATERILSEAVSGSRLCISTGYFNLTRQYMKTLINESKAKCDILMAHPRANGFLGAKGAAGGIPYAYSLIAKQFKNSCERGNQQNRIRLFEYLKEGWTFHGKGLWYYPPKGNTPCLTLIGSPNFGSRSVEKDLETQIAIITENEDLRQDLDKECRRLYQLGLPAETERKVSPWVYGFVLFFRSYF